MKINRENKSQFLFLSTEENFQVSVYDTDSSDNSDVEEANRGYDENCDMSSHMSNREFAFFFSKCKTTSGRTVRTSRAH